MNQVDKQIEEQLSEEVRLIRAFFLRKSNKHSKAKEDLLLGKRWKG